MFSKTYELPLSPGYVRHWGCQQAVRELIQNALDSDSPFEYEFTTDSLYITSRFAKLEPSTLLLGATTKADSPDKIGSHGEGYKIALLVLTREGYRVKVHNGDRLWIPSLRESKQFGAKVLVVEDLPAERKREGVTFEVGGLSPSDIDTIRASCLFMQEHVGAVMTVEEGAILREQRGKLYVGGLFVCDTELQFGYNVKPAYLSLDRDRQTVRNFDLLWLTKDMWFKTERWDEMAALIESECPDLEYAEHGAPEFVKEACYRHFCAKNPGKVLVKSQKELEHLVSKGMTNVVYSRSPGYTTLATSSHTYRETVSTPKPKTAPQVELEAWLGLNKRHMRRASIAAFQTLIERAAAWKL